MSTPSETGHAINVANFEQLISICTRYGTIYNPTKKAIQLSELNALLINAQDSLVETNKATAIYKTTVNARSIAFAPLKKIITKVVASLDATDASQQTVDNAKTIARKLQGRRAIPKKIANQNSPIDTPQKEVKTISASQLSYDNQIENFSKIILLLASEPYYIPNETDIKLETLKTLLATFQTTNSNVIHTNVTLKNTRINRNITLYQPTTGLLDIQREVKKYIKSIFGTTSPEYKQITSLKFTEPR